MPFDIDEECGLDPWLLCSSGEISNEHSILDDEGFKNGVLIKIETDTVEAMSAVLVLWNVRATNNAL